MSKYDALFEDEDDIFTGTPQSKFLDAMRNANTQIVDDELDKIIEKYAIMELILSENKDESFDINKILDEYALKNSDKVHEMKKSLYIEFTGEVIQRLDS
ncbi:hypothetical protein CP960_01040 [Malaciobacter halophilus]|uniref:DUF2018 domain-containing protein n=1 Tax=Malaciobacter halophilus TaxID=197482 RepID=A0A2N1J6A6_9BACT|nr:DUF2018 family protein [Malaciobacter halophilus]AXH08847.1 DUF2018 domain-containing protein [Malaciobacter halophilus]PKI82076.1 hypothetical protein CP960_01040 [Malaciobacter halophilus]